MSDVTQRIQQVGNGLVDIFHYIALFIIGATVIWSAAYEYLEMMERGYAGLKDILLLFIYLELGAMIGIYFKTHKLPVQYLIFIAITALSRHLVIDAQKVTDNFHLYLLITIAISILVLSVALMLLSYSSSKFGRPEDNISSSE